MRLFWLDSVAENRTDEMLLCAPSYWQGLVEKMEPGSSHSEGTRGNGDKRDRGKSWLDGIFSFPP